MSELKPCPFCGENHSIDSVNGLGGLRYYVVMFTDKECYHGFYTTEEDAARAWNSRPIEDKFQAEIERLKSELAKVPVMDFDAAIKALKGIIEYVEHFDSIEHLSGKAKQIVENAYKAIGSIPKEK